MTQKDNSIYNQRQTLRNQLSVAWLKTKRLDVWEAIEVEVDKQYPMIRGKRAPVKLPAGLEKISK